MQFCKGQNDIAESIRNALLSGDRDTAEREVHTLKGAAGNVGAVDIQAVATSLEAAIKEDADIEAMITELEQKLGTLVEELASLEPAPKPGEVARRENSAGLLQLLDRLEELLQNADGEALGLVSEIESQAADSELARPLQEIGELIDDFEFEQALDRLHNLREVVTS